MSVPEVARLAFDIGGTFTDVVLERGDKVHSTKVLTTPDAPERGAMRGIADVLATSGMRGSEIGLIVHGTTLATNAIIERKGARTALITTEGFRDSIEIAYENRFEQYDIFIEKPAPLVPRQWRFAVPERLNVRGDVLRSLDMAAVDRLIPELVAAEIESVAIGFLHSYANPDHERRVAERLGTSLPGLALTLSSEVCPEIREYERFSTAVANAYVQPRMATYLARLEEMLKAAGFECPMFLITSGGGLTTFETAQRFPIRLVESGPAGGAILAARIAAECDLPRLVSFDMGGTTAKICLIDDFTPQKSRLFEVDRRYRFAKGSGLPLRIPVIEMVEIGAGGGSIAAVDALKRVNVGPESSGSSPGPACYGLGGTEPTVTDADVLLGRIAAEGFADGRIRLDAGRSADAVNERIGAALSMDASLAALAISEVVEENMANATRVHAVERGKTLADRTLVAFGGAAPLHAARLAEKLGVSHVIVPAGAGVGSAVGFLRAPIAFEIVRSLHARLDAFDAGAVNAAFAAMAEEAYREVRRGAPGEDLVETRTADMRYRGQGHEVSVPVPTGLLGAGDGASLHVAFEECYRALFGRTIPGMPVEVLTWTLTVSTQSASPKKAEVAGGSRAAPAIGTRSLLDPTTERFHEVAVHARSALAPGLLVSGPAVIVEPQTTTIVTPGFDAAVDSSGHLHLMARNPAGGEVLR